MPSFIENYKSSHLSTLEAAEVTVGVNDPNSSNMHFPLTTLFSSFLFAILVSSQVVDLDKSVEMCNDSLGIPSAVPGGFSNVDCDDENVKEATQLIQVPGAEILGVTSQVVNGEKFVFFVVSVLRGSHDQQYTSLANIK